jgi:hypothetical protein
VALAGISLLGLAPAALAQPTNDDFDNATPIDQLPFTDRLSIEGATSAGDDPDCAIAFYTVWYSFTPGEDIRVEANTFGSSYDTTLSAYVGTRGNLDQIACNDDVVGSLQSRIRFDAEEGETVYFMIGSFSEEIGDLVFNVLEAGPPEPPLEISLTIDPVATVDQRTGKVTISLTITCSRDAWIDLEVELAQRHGRRLIEGFLYDSLVCLGEVAWTDTTQVQTGAFVPGRAVATVGASAITEDLDFAFEEETAELRLRPFRPSRQ